MKKIPLILLLWVSSCMGLEQNNLYLKTGAQAGVPYGLGAHAKVVAYVLNLDIGLSYGYFVNTLNVGAGFRLPFGERSEFFLNAGFDEILSKRMELNLTDGVWAEIQYERKFGRKSMSVFSSFGVSAFPEVNEKNVVYLFPILKLGIRKEIIGVLR